MPGTSRTSSKVSRLDGPKRTERGVAIDSSHFRSLFLSLIRVVLSFRVSSSVLCNLGLLVQSHFLSALTGWPETPPISNLCSATFNEYHNSRPSVVWSHSALVVVIVCLTLFFLLLLILYSRFLLLFLLVIVLPAGHPILSWRHLVCPRVFRLSKPSTLPSLYNLITAQICKISLPWALGWLSVTLTLCWPWSWNANGIQDLKVTSSGSLYHPTLT